MSSLLHFFVHCKGTTKYSFEFGSYKILGGKAKKVEVRSDESQWRTEIALLFNRLPIEKQNILFYIHGLWADNKHFVATSTAILQEEIFNATQSPYGLIISLQWEAGISYKKNYLNAQNKGKAFASILENILADLHFDGSNIDVSFLNHSMGNIVFDALTNALVESNRHFKFKYALLMAADLPDDIFQSTMKSMPQFFGAIYVYYNLNDKTLQVAHAMSPKARIGIYGPVTRELLPSNIKLRDASDIKDNESFFSSVTFHRYFYTSPTIRAEILSILSQ